MSIAELQGMLDYIQYMGEIDGDNEKAHGLEHRMRTAVLKAISEGAENAQELATMALSSEDFDFDRWFA